MEKYIVPVSPTQNSNPKYRYQWKRRVSELKGKISHKNRHEDSQILINSYFEVGAFEHFYRIGTERCPTHTTRLSSIENNYTIDCLFREGVTALEFDSKGIYLASVTKSGCLTIHDFETLYCLTFGPSSCSVEDESKQLMHITSSHSLEAVRWNPTNQNEIACSSKRNNKVLLYDIGYVSSEPAEVLHRGNSKNSSEYGEVCTGLSDIVFPSDDKSRVISSGLDGAVYVWDRRSSCLPCLELSTTSHRQLTSVELDKENRVVFGASEHGFIYAWDLRGGRTTASHAFQNLSKAYHPPLMSLKVSSKLEKISALRAQTYIRPKEIHAINFDPSCSHQLAFHLDDGWSGVLNLNSLNVTHMHCPPPAWLENQGNGVICSSLRRRPAWLPSCSIYAVASSASKGIHLVDFFPTTGSAAHVDYNEESQTARNKYCNVSQSVISCAAHPLNGTIIAGTRHSSLLLISDKQHPHLDFETQTS